MKEKWYKRKWAKILGIGLAAYFAFFFVYTAFGPEPSEEVSETEESTEVEDLSFDLTIDTELGYGEFIVGEDLEPGSYTCTVNPGEDVSGSIVVYGKPDEGGALDDDLTSSVDITVEEGDTIKISGISSVHFEPKE